MASDRITLENSNGEKCIIRFGDDGYIYFEDENGNGIRWKSKS